MYGQHLTIQLSQKKLWQLQLNRVHQTEKRIHGFLGGVVVLLQKSVIYNLREALIYGSFTLERAAGKVGSVSVQPQGQ